MKNLRKYSFGVLGLSLLLTAASCGPNKSGSDAKEVAEDQNKEKLDHEKELKDDFEFAVNAADGGMLEVQLGQLALYNGSSDRVKEFGQMMVTDHTKANEELKSLAAAKNISLPVVLGEKCQKKYDDLAKLKGVEFDKAYTSLMVDDHKNDIDAFRKEGENGKDPELKSWAYNKVPTLEHHLEVSKTNKDAVHK